MEIIIKENAESLKNSTNIIDGTIHESLNELYNELTLSVGHDIWQRLYSRYHFEDPFSQRSYILYLQVHIFRQFLKSKKISIDTETERKFIRFIRMSLVEMAGNAVDWSALESRFRDEILRNDFSTLRKSLQYNIALIYEKRLKNENQGIVKLILTGIASLAEIFLSDTDIVIKFNKKELKGASLGEFLKKYDFMVDPFGYLMLDYINWLRNPIHIQNSLRKGYKPDQYFTLAILSYLKNIILISFNYYDWEHSPLGRKSLSEKKDMERH